MSIHTVFLPERPHRKPAVILAYLIKQSVTPGQFMIDICRHLFYSYSNKSKSFSLPRQKNLSASIIESVKA